MLFKNGKNFKNLKITLYENEKKSSFFKNELLDLPGFRTLEGLFFLAYKSTFRVATLHPFAKLRTRLRLYKYLLILLPQEPSSHGF